MSIVKKLFVSATIVSAVLVSNVVLANTLDYDFAGGSSQGWMSIDLDSGNPGPWTAFVVGGAVPGISDVGGDGYFVQPNLATWGNPYPQDSQNSTKIFRSPKFQADGTGGITAWLQGGKVTPGVWNTDYSTDMPTQSTDGGFIGLALRRVSDNRYVDACKVPYSADLSSYEVWQKLTFPAASLDTGTIYTLDLLDAGHGGYGSVVMDSVTLHGTATPEPSALLLLTTGMIGLLCYAWRKHK